MKIVLNDKQDLLSKIAAVNVETKAYSLLGRHMDIVKSIVITIRDINGPRGGVDKECQVVVKLRKMQDVVVSGREASLSKVIIDSINRASRTVGRAVDRRSVRAGGMSFLRAASS